MKMDAVAYDLKAPTDEGTAQPPRKKKCKSKSGSAKYRSKFCDKWTKRYPFIVRGGDIFSFHCNTCNRSVSCGHMGFADVERHIRCKLHIRNADWDAAAAAKSQDPTVTDKFKMNAFLQRKESPSTCRRKKYRSKFCEAWTRRYPFITKGDDMFTFHCHICDKSMSCGHMGIADVERHVSGKQHRLKANRMKSQEPLHRDQTVTDKVGQADVKVATLLSQNSIPLDLADELTPLFPDIFPDSKISKDFSSKRTKTACITNTEVTPYIEGEMIPNVVRHPFSLVIDGSSDNGMEEINPMRVRIFDSGQVSMQFLDLQCVSTEDTLQTLFLKMDDALCRHLIEWENCVGVAVDNTSLTVCGDPIKTHVRDKNPATYIVDCGCHIVHNTASKASDAFEQVSGFSVEEMATDLFHWFDNSTKQKMDPVQYHTFCDITYQQAVKHVDTRWLNLETTVSRILQQYGSLKSYFLSKDDKAPYFGRLRVLFEDPMTEVCLLFYQSALQTFLQFNSFLEREDPVIPIVHAQMQSFLQKLASKFVRVQTIKAAKGDFMNMHYKAPDVQLPDNSLFIGFGAKTLLNKLLNEGSISGHQASKFYEGVRAFYSRAFSYTLGQLPLDDRLLRNAAFVNFRRRENAALSEVEYFIDRFSALLPFQSPQEMDKLADEFSAYQLMNDEVVPQSVWSKAKVSEDGLHRLDVIWQHLSLLKAPDNTLLLPRLSKVATLVLVIPHSSS